MQILNEKWPWSVQPQDTFSPVANHFKICTDELAAVPFASRLAKRSSAGSQLIDVPIVGAQRFGNCLRSAQANRSALDINQQSRAIQRWQSGAMLQTPVRYHQQSLLFGGETLAPLPQPLLRLQQRREQRCATARSQRLQPRLQTTGRFESLHVPCRRRTTGGQQSEPRALAVGVVEQLREQTFGIAQSLMASGRSGGVDDHQPQLVRRAGAQLKQQVFTQSWPPVEQRAGPVHRATAGALALALASVVEPSGAGSGIRPRVGSGANA